MDENRGSEYFRGLLVCAGKMRRAARLRPAAGAAGVGKGAPPREHVRPSLVVNLVPSATHPWGNGVVPDRGGYK